MPQCAQTVFDVGPNLGSVLTAGFTLIAAAIGGYVGHAVTRAVITRQNGAKS